VVLDLNRSIPEILTAVAPLVEQNIQSLIPRAYEAQSVAEAFGDPAYRFDAASLSEALARPVWYCIDAGGKRWRPALMLVAAAGLGADPATLCDFAAMCEIIHNGTLIIDDIEDDSPLRRGRDAVHVAFGCDVAVNAANFLYFLPVHAVIARRHDLPESTRLKVCEIVAQEMARLHAGQAMDIAWHRGFRLPDVEEYLQMCAFKTGTLARMSVRIAAAVAAAAEPVAQALGRYAESIGVAFQIQDDILNVTPSALSKAKGLGEDIHEGKTTLLVIHALACLARPRRERLLAILRSHPSDQGTINEAIGLLAECGAVDFARRTAREIVRRAWDDAARFLPANPAGEKLREFGEFAISRSV